MPPKKRASAVKREKRASEAVGAVVRKRGRGTAKQQKSAKAKAKKRLITLRDLKRMYVTWCIKNGIMVKKGNEPGLGDADKSALNAEAQRAHAKIKEAGVKIANASYNLQKEDMNRLYNLCGKALTLVKQRKAGLVAEVSVDAKGKPVANEAVVKEVLDKVFSGEYADADLAADAQVIADVELDEMGIRVVEAGENTGNAKAAANRFVKAATATGRQRALKSAAAGAQKASKQALEHMFVLFQKVYNSKNAIEMYEKEYEKEKKE